jgi:hypothetical protein
MSAFPGYYFDPFGSSLIPSVYICMPYERVPGEITTITIPILQSQTRDYAKELLNRVRYLRDTYVTAFEPGAVLPNAQAFKDAESFILQLPLNRTEMPTINVASDGEVNFCWSNRNGAHIDLGFFGNGTYSYYAGNAGKEIMGENIETKSNVPDELIEIAASSA